ncbi:cytochrome P450 [Streptomyces sp. NPDC049577]|uniref:cytochrome P450 family protein n=1 Tax=Streptomyces sp. NPDC049577 TaxID=3155153 RepID=UPI00341E40B3
MQRSSCPFVLDPTGRDLRGETALLSARGPATLVELPGGVRAWSVTGYELARRLMLDPRVSKDAYRHWPAWISGEVDHTWPLAMWVSVQNMLTAYGDEHHRLRRLVVKAFTARRTASLKPRIESIVNELLDDLAALPPGETVDLKQRFSYPLPIRVICEMLGIEERLRDDLHRVVDVLFTTTTTAEEAQANQFELYRLLSELVAGKRANPGADMTSDLIAARDEGDGTGLSEKELVDTLLLIIGAGHETTVNLLDQAVLALLTHPEQRELVRDGRATWDDVIEETLRARGPVANIPLRFAVEDIEAGDVLIAAGDAILISVLGAGHDRVQHGEDATAFDITRATRRDHIAFGHGAHHCPGAPLARLEASLALPALFERFPGLSLAVPVDELRPLPSFISYGHQELPVRLKH